MSPEKSRQAFLNNDVCPLRNSPIPLMGEEMQCPPAVRRKKYKSIAQRRTKGYGLLETLKLETDIVETLTYN